MSFDVRSLGVRIVKPALDRPFSSFFLKSTGSMPPLRIGIQLDDMTVEHAAASVIEDVLAADFTQIRCVILASERSASRGLMAGRLQRAASIRWVAWRVVTWFDARRSRVDDPSAMRDVGPRLAGVETIEARWDRDDSERARLDQAGLERVRAADLDVIVQLGRARPDETVVDLPRHGIWRFRHGDPDRYADGEPDFWEMIAGDPVTVVSLERLGSSARGGAIIGSATFATDMGSPARQRVMPLFGSTYLVIRALWQLHERGPAWLEAHLGVVAPRPNRDLPQGPTDRAVLGWFVRGLVRRTRRRLLAMIGRRELTSTWQTAIRVGHERLGLAQPADMADFRWVEPPPGHHYADPFMFERDGQSWLFVEDIDEHLGRGVISCAEVAPDGAIGEPRAILVGDAHLSYPLVFEDGGQTYLLPESRAEGRVRLYRAASFPDRWEAVADLYDGPAMDTTVWHDDRWWFFTSLREPRGLATMLWLFHADTLTGPWISHPMNPISSDIRDARGAGAITRQDGVLIRPSQDGSLGYGSGFSLREIVTLSTEAYADRPLVHVDASWAPGMTATHTYNRSGRFEVTDAKRRPVARHDDGRRADDARSSGS